MPPAGSEPTATFGGRRLARRMFAFTRSTWRPLLATLAMHSSAREVSNSPGSPSQSGEPASSSMLRPRIFSGTNTQQAYHALCAAERLAPQELSGRPAVHRLISDTRAGAPLGLSRQVEELAQRTGVAI